MVENGGTSVVKTSDVARLMELFQVSHLRGLDDFCTDVIAQSSLLRYWEFKPKVDENSEESKQSKEVSEESGASETAHGSNASENTQHERKGEKTSEGQGNEKESSKSSKKIPVFFFDEAHKLYVGFS